METNDKKNRRSFLLPMLFAILVSPAWSSAQQIAAPYGRFEGEVVTRWLEDGRRMELLQPFAYIAPDGLRWEAPQGSIVDGASIPRIAWSAIGGPFEGAYRKASVIHDVACHAKAQPWESVHEAFFNAMLAANVEPLRAKVMYAAVYYFGPRWPRVWTVAGVRNEDIQRQIEVETDWNTNEDVEISIRRDDSGALASVEPRVIAGSETVDLFFRLPPEEPTLQPEDFAVLQQRIESEDLSLEEIRAYGDELP